MKLTVRRSYSFNEQNTYEIVTVWEEADSCISDRECLADAWKRIVGRELHSKDRTEWIDDQGDWAAYLHRGGWVEIHSCDGAQIGVLAEVRLLNSEGPS